MCGFFTGRPELRELHHALSWGYTSSQKRRKPWICRRYIGMFPWSGPEPSSLLEEKIAVAQTRHSHTKRFSFLSSSACCHPPYAVRNGNNSASSVKMSVFCASFISPSDQATSSECGVLEWSAIAMHRRRRHCVVYTAPL
jgi:hypothetical protein